MKKALIAVTLALAVTVTLLVGSFTVLRNDTSLEDECYWWAQGFGIANISVFGQLGQPTQQQFNDAVMVCVRSRSEQTADGQLWPELGKTAALPFRGG